MTEETPLEELANEPENKLIPEETAEKPAEEAKSEEAVEADKVVEKEKAKRRLSDRLKEQTYQRREAERQADALRAENEKLKASSKITQEPDPDDYADRDQYNRDKELFTEQEVDNRVNQKLQQEKERERQAQADREINKKTVEYVTERAKVIEVDSSYREHERDVDDVVKAYGVPEIHNAILKGGGPAMVTYLGKHSDELTDIALMSPEDRLFELGKIAAKVKAKSPKKISSAPDPTRSDRGSATQSKATGGSKHVFNKNESFKDRAKRLNGR